ncbi:MAG: hypothetical protein K0R22_2548 [Sporomusa sp.]|nr:hypothetical protein [Sporomusa sp.]
MTANIIATTKTQGVIFMTELLSIKDISQELGIPQSTLRYYRDLFLDYLPAMGEGKKKRFYPEAVEVFQAIAKCMHQNKSSDDIANELDSRFTRFIEIDTEPQESSATYSHNDETGQSQALSTINQFDGSTIMAVIASQNQALQQIAATISMVNGQQEELHNLKQEVSKLEERIETELTDHFQLIDARLRQIREEKEIDKPKSFWQRLFS